MHEDGEAGDLLDQLIASLPAYVRTWREGLYAVCHTPQGRFAVLLDHDVETGPALRVCEMVSDDKVVPRMGETLRNALRALGQQPQGLQREALLH